MLTVKHIGADGTETLVEARQIEVVRGKGRFEDGIFLDRSPESFSTTGGPEPRTIGHVFHFLDCEPEERNGARVFVMNRFGATVAQYNL